MKKVKKVTTKAPYNIKPRVSMMKKNPNKSGVAKKLKTPGKGKFNGKRFEKTRMNVFGLAKSEDMGKK